MKRVSFEGWSDFWLTLQADFSDSAAGEGGQVRVQAEGIDVDSSEEKEVKATVWGFFNPDEAREIARYFTEMADAAEKGAA